MMQKYRESQLCTFGHCYPTRKYLQEEDVSAKSNRRESRGQKISLKRVQSKSALVNTQQKSEINQEYLTQITTPTVIEPIKTIAVTPRVTAWPTSPKPKITFAWKTDLERTKKAQNTEEQPVAINVVDSELEKTKPVSKMLKIPSNLHLSTYKASLISIPDSQPKHPPKVQQSLIVVNYFNPTIQQRKTLQTFLERKELEDQN